MSAPAAAPEPGARAAELAAEVPASVAGFLRAVDPLRAALHADQGLRARLPRAAEEERAFLARFIIATNGDVDAALKQIKEFVGWYEDLDVQRMYSMPALQVIRSTCDLRYIDERYPLYIRGTDRYGHPVLYAKNGRLNINQIFEHVQEDNFIRYHSWLRERMMRMRDEQLAARGPRGPYSPLDAQYTVVMDFEGASMSQLKKPFSSVVKKTMHIDQTYYPERMFRSILINVPLLFSACWAIVKNFLDKDTLSKLRIVRSDYFKYLEEIIDPAEIPADFGGTAPPLAYEDHASQVTERFFAKQKALAAQASEREAAASSSAKSAASGSPAKSSSPAKPSASSTVESAASSPAKSVASSPAKSVASSPAKSAEREAAAIMKRVESQDMAKPQQQRPAITTKPAAVATSAPSASASSSTPKPANDQCEPTPTPPASALLSAHPPIAGASGKKEKQLQSSLHDLQVALLRAYLEFELVERETLEENEYLRRQIEERQNELAGISAVPERPPLAPPGGPSAGHDGLPSPLDDEITALEAQVERLRKDLEETLEETSAHQRAISFARALIDEGAQDAQRDTQLLRLKAERERLLVEHEALAQALGSAGVPLADSR